MNKDRELLNKLGKDIIGQVNGIGIGAFDLINFFNRDLHLEKDINSFTDDLFNLYGWLNDYNITLYDLNLSENSTANIKNSEGSNLSTYEKNSNDKEIFESKENITHQRVNDNRNEKYQYIKKIPANSSVKQKVGNSSENREESKKDSKPGKSYINDNAYGDENKNINILEKENSDINSKSIKSSELNIKDNNGYNGEPVERKENQKEFLNQVFDKKYEDKRNHIIEENKSDKINKNTRLDENKNPYEKESNQKCKMKTRSFMDFARDINKKEINDFNRENFTEGKETNKNYKNSVEEDITIDSENKSKGKDISFNKHKRIINNLAQDNVENKNISSVGKSDFFKNETESISTFEKDKIETYKYSDNEKNKREIRDNHDFVNRVKSVKDYEEYKEEREYLEEQFIKELMDSKASSKESSDEIMKKIYKEIQKEYKRFYGAS